MSPDIKAVIFNFNSEISPSLEFNVNLASDKAIFDKLRFAK